METTRTGSQLVVVGAKTAKVTDGWKETTMAKCLRDKCDNEVKGRRYCCGDCKQSQKLIREAGGDIEDIMERYAPVQPNLDLLKHGAWLMFRVSFEPKVVVGDFMRAFKRPPEHVIYDPQTPDWQYAGPVWTDEEMAWRWKGSDDKTDQTELPDPPKRTKIVRSDPR
jgi:hypothetical protein